MPCGVECGAHGTATLRWPPPDNTACTLSSALVTLHDCAQRTLLVGSEAERWSTRLRGYNVSERFSLECALRVLNYAKDRRASNLNWTAYSRVNSSFWLASKAAVSHSQQETPGCTSDGAFQLDANETQWPAKHHYLDEPLAHAVAELVGNGTILDLGAGSGQYGAHFAQLGVKVLERRVVLPAGVPRYRGVDGVKNVEACTGVRDRTAARLR